MAYGIRTANDGTYAAITSGTEDVARFGGRNGDNSGQLAGFRNILINPRISAGINQRGVANWAAVAIGAYGYDRWKKVDASTITQIVEDGNYTPSTVYTLSGNVTATQQVTSPVSGHWTIPAISNLETDIQLEEGYIATKKERRPKGLEEFLCQRYTRPVGHCTGQCYTTTNAVIFGFGVLMRATPALSTTTGFKVTASGLAEIIVTAIGVGLSRGDGSIYLGITTAGSLVAGSATYLSTIPAGAVLTAEL